MRSSWWLADRALRRPARCGSCRDAWPHRASAVSPKRRCSRGPSRGRRRACPSRRSECRSRTRAGRPRRRSRRRRRLTRSRRRPIRLRPNHPPLRRLPSNRLPIHQPRNHPPWLHRRCHQLRSHQPRSHQPRSDRRRAQCRHHDLTFATAHPHESHDKPESMLMNTSVITCAQFEQAFVSHRETGYASVRWRVERLNGRGGVCRGRAVRTAVHAQVTSVVFSLVLPQSSRAPLPCALAVLRPHPRPAHEMARSSNALDERQCPARAAPPTRPSASTAPLPLAREDEA